MIDPDKVHALLTQTFAGAEVTVQDLTGAGDHFQVIVVSEAFRGKPLLAQHKMVHDALAPLAADIHALAIRTLAPA